MIENETRVFSLTELKTWQTQLDGYNAEVFDKKDEAEKVRYLKTLLDSAENKEVIKNLIYASLILFYNILLKDHKDKTYKATENLIEELIEILNKTVMDFFEDSMIVNVVLQLITLFTNKSDNPSLFNHPKILKYVFSRLKREEPGAK